MDFNLTRQQALLRDMVREFAEKDLAPQALRLDEEGEFPFDLARKMAQLGLVGLVTPKEMGGTGMGHLARMIAIEEVSRVYAPMGFFLETDGIGVYLIQAFGSEEQKKRYLGPLLRGENFSCFALTEPTGGSDPSTMQSTAQSSGDEYILNGRKVFITLAEASDIACTVVRTGERFSAFLVEKGTPGFEIARRESHAGLRCLPVNEIAFTNCRVPKGNLIGEEGRGMAAALATINVIARTGMAGIGLGLAEGSYQAALKFAKERKLYGRPIAELQALQFMLVDMNVEIEAARWLCYYAAWLLDEGKSPREVSTEIARAKLYACDVANRVAPKAVQVMGGYGTAPEYHALRHLRDALELLPAAGTPEIMKVTIGRGLLG